MNFRDEWATDKDGNHFVFTVEMKRRLYEAGLPVEVASLDQLEDVGPPARAEPRPQRSEAPEREEVIGPATIQIDPETGKYVGRLKWYNPARGYGFIAREGGPDVFVHFSAIRSTGYRELNEGDRVEFSITQGPKGPQASNVVRLGN